MVTSTSSTIKFATKFNQKKSKINNYYYFTTKTKQNKTRHIQTNITTHTNIYTHTTEKHNTTKEK
ncbi:MAG: hypothetical protein EAY75_11705, partial [Bacteroidetes bacterium]